MINRIRENFTQVDNSILNNKDLSLKAKGLYAFLCSKPETWKFNYSGLKNQLQEGERAIKSAIKELVDIKVLLRISIRGKQGFEGWEWIINPSEEDLEKYIDPLNKLQNVKGTKCMVHKVSGTQSVMENSNNDLSNTNISNNNNNISKDIEQSSEIIKEDKRILEIDLIIETLKECNMGVVDDTIKKQRQYGKLIKSKMEKIKGFNGDYVGFIKYAYENSDKYRKNYFRSVEKFYFNLAGIISGLKIKNETKPNLEINMI